MGSADNDRNSFFDNSGFLFGNLRQRVTQILGVVEAYVGDNTQIRMDDIRTVQSSAHAYFDNCYIYFLVGKITECHSGGQFEE